MNSANSSCKGCAKAPPSALFARILFTSAVLSGIVANAINLSIWVVLKDGSRGKIKLLKKLYNNKSKRKVKMPEFMMVIMILTKMKTLKMS